MSRIACGLAALSVSLLLVPEASPAAAATAATAAKPPAKQAYASRRTHLSRHWRGYGFLPGYRPPEVIEFQRERQFYESGPHYYGPAWPGYYRGRWNGGGFGPCYTYTPIGYVWNCGK
jgi:hypothetical protein